MIKLHKALVASAVAALVFSGQAHAALFDRGGGMIYDSTWDITWLADMNYAKTSGNDSDGLMNWIAANEWAESLVYGGFDDWRLPTINPYDTTCDKNYNPGGGLPDQYYGFNCTGGELSHLFIVYFGNKTLESVLNQVGDTAEQVGNLALFSNVQSYYYWSGTRSWDGGALSFESRGAQQSGGDITLDEFYVVAVRPGDVQRVPEPVSLALVGVALALIAASRCRKV